MFFDTLESRQMFSVSIPSHPVIHRTIQLPAQLHVSSNKKAAKPVTVGVTAAQTKVLVNAVFNSEVNLLEDVFTGKLKNLVQDVSDLKSKFSKIGGSQLQSLLGSTVAVGESLPSSQLAGLQTLSTTISRLPGELSGKPKLTGDRNSEVSDAGDTAISGVAGGGTAVAVGAESGALPVAAIFGGGGAGAAAVGAATAGVAGAAAAGVAVGKAIDTTTTYFQGESIGDNWADVYGQAYYNATGGDIVGTVANWIGSLFGGSSGSDSTGNKGGSSGTPVPTDDTAASPGFITAADVKNVLARLGALTQPTQDDTGKGTGGALNTGATGTGSLNSKAMFTQDNIASKSVNISAGDLASLAIKLSSKVTTTH